MRASFSTCRCVIPRLRSALGKASGILPLAGVADCAMCVGIGDAKPEERAVVDLKSGGNGFRSKRRWAVIVPLIALALVSCNRRKEAYVPPEQEPPAPERPVRIPSLAEGRPAPLPQMGMRTGGTPETISRENTPAATGDPIKGTLRLAEGVAGAGTGVVFVTVFAGAGPPLAAIQMPVGAFPMPFSIGPEDMMIKGRPWAGDLRIEARIDRDGNASTREPENLVGQPPAAVQPGAADVEIVLGPSGR